jgi:hypothetical protein
MTLTPSSKSAFISGMALSLVAWLTIFKLNDLAKLFRVQRFVSQRKVLTWVNENKALTLLGTEFVNYGVHGVTGVESVTFALGSTLFNAITIFVLLPLKYFLDKKRFGSNRIHVMLPLANRAKIAS